MPLRPAHLAAATLALALSAPGASRATASGPDTFRVTAAGEGSALTLRSAPAAEADPVGEVPAGTDGLVNLGCTGGLSLAEFTEATEAERAEAAASRWCLVGFERRIGWAHGPDLAEGSAPGALDAGGRLSRLAGSEWRPFGADLGDGALEQILAFADEAAVAGTGGCNRFRGTYEQDGEALAFGPLAMTQMACPDQFMEAEAAFLQLISQTGRAVAHHLLLVLLGDDGRILIQLQRSDPD